MFNVVWWYTALIYSNIVGTIREYFHIHEFSDHYAQQTSSVDAIAARDLEVGARWMAMSTEIETRVLVGDHGSSIGAVANRAFNTMALDNSNPEYQIVGLWLPEPQP